MEKVDLSILDTFGPVHCCLMKWLEQQSTGLWEVTVLPATVILMLSGESIFYRCGHARERGSIRSSQTLPLTAAWRDEEIPAENY